MSGQDELKPSKKRQTTTASSSDKCFREFAWSVDQTSVWLFPKSHMGTEGVPTWHGDESKLD